MTRINVVPVTELHNKHLSAEYYELPRVFKLVERFQGKGGTPGTLIGQPSFYVLGEGHVKFFYTRLLWLSWRHLALVNELSARGFNPTFTQNLRVPYAHLASHWWDDWEPGPDELQAALALNRQRIAERLEGMSS